jgi:hypothetical protein
MATVVAVAQPIIKLTTIQPIEFTPQLSKDSHTFNHITPTIFKP